MRGSGCSGGAFDLFGLPTTYDGYDAVETVAAQPWVKGGKVGLAGISFSGITQLFTAGTRPPHLAAIAPMSVTDDIYAATGFPGGIRNSGFAASWVQERMDDARPAPAGGQPYARALVAAGDKHCRANQRLRLQTQDAVALQSRATRTARRRCSPHRSPGAWMRPHRRADVPRRAVPGRADRRALRPRASARLRRNPKVWISLQNGVHADSLGPATITRWVEFLKLYVADEVPRDPRPRPRPERRALPLPRRRGRRAGRSSRASPATTDVAAAQAELRARPARAPADGQRRGPGRARARSAPAWELGFDAWPVARGPAATLVPRAGGALDRAPRRHARRRSSYVADPGARPRADAAGHGRDGRLEGPAAVHVGAAWPPARASASRRRRSPRDVVIAGPVEPRPAAAVLRARTPTCR